MAEAATKTKRQNRSKFDTIKNLKEDFLTCGICLDYFNNPKSLICLHKFCETCLQAYVEKLCHKPGNKFQCPMKCKEYTTLPKNGVKGLKTDFILKGLDEFLSVKETERKSEKRSVKDIFGLVENEVKCSDHGGKICELYCQEENCQVPVCTKCISTEHNGHKVAEIDTIVKNSKDILDNLNKEVEYEIILAEERSWFSQKMLEEVIEIVTLDVFSIVQYLNSTFIIGSKSCRGASWKIYNRLGRYFRQNTTKGNSVKGKCYLLNH